MKIVKTGHHLVFVTNDDLLILDCPFSHLIWSDVMIKKNNKMVKTDEKT